MTDPNRPAEWHVRDIKRDEIVFMSSLLQAATTFCRDMESDEHVAEHGYRFVVEPVRPADSVLRIQGGAGD